MAVKVVDKKAEAERTPESPEVQSQDYCYEKDLRTALPQILAVSVKNCLLLGIY